MTFSSFAFSCLLDMRAIIQDFTYVGFSSSRWRIVILASFLSFFYYFSKNVSDKCLIHYSPQYWCSNTNSHLNIVRDIMEETLEPHPNLMEILLGLAQWPACWPTGLRLTGLQQLTGLQLLPRLTQADYLHHPRHPWGHPWAHHQYIQSICNNSTKTVSSEATDLPLCHLEMKWVPNYNKLFFYKKFFLDWNYYHYYYICITVLFWKRRIAKYIPKCPSYLMFYYVYSPIN